MRVRRLLVIGLIVAVAVPLLAWVGLKAYLQSGAARGLAAERLTAAVGLPIQVDSLSVGGSETSLAFRVMEPATNPDRPPAEILRVHSATADVSLRDLVAGSAAPTEVTVHGAALTLAVGPDGKLLTAFPQSTGGGGESPKIPTIRVTDGTVKFRSAGKPDFVLGGISIRATPADGKVQLAGTADDPKWGKWEVAGEADIATKTGRVVLTTAGATLSQELLRSIPFVPGEVWEQVTAAGETAAKITFTLGADSTFGYDVELTPKGATVGVPAIDATFADVRGTIRVRGAKVVLENCTGTLAGGPVTVGSEMDFGPDPSRLKFDVTARGVDVGQLPAAWGLPKQFAGKLRGKAGLELKVYPGGRVEPLGGGAATIEGATVAGLPADVTLRLRGDGKRYRFQSENARAGSRTVPVRRQVGRLAEPAKKDPPAEEPTTFEANIALRDIDLGELLNRLNLKIPYTFAGKVTVKASVVVPLAKAGNTKNYRVNGSVTSPAFTFQGFTVRDLSATVKYDDGVLKLTSLRATMPAAGDKPTDKPRTLSGTATAEIEPRGKLTAALELDRVPLAELRKAMPGDLPDVAGAVSGTGEFAAPFDQLADPATWTATGTLRSDDLSLFGRAVRDAVVGVKIANGTATLADTKFTVEGIPAAVDGTLALAAPFGYAARVRTAGTQVGEITKLIPGFDPPFAIAGKFETDTRVKGTASPFTSAASGTAAVTDLKLGDSDGNKAAFGWELGDERVKVTDLAADLFGGKLTGSADVPFAADMAGRFAVKFADFDVSAATKQLKEFPVRLTGKLSGGVTGTLPAAAKGQSRTLTADVDVTAPKLTVQGIPAERLTGAVKYDRGAIEYSLEGRALGGTFDVKGTYPQKAKAPADPPAPPRERGSFRGRNLDLGRLGAALGVAGLGSLRGTVDATLDFAGDLSEGDGRVTVRGLAWGDARLASELVVRLKLRDGLVTADDFGGTLAGGLLRGRARYDIRRPGRNFFSVTLDRADAEKLLAATPDLSETVTGPVSVVVRGKFAPSPEGTGTLTLERGTVGELAATDLRVPFDWAIGTGAGRVAVREAAGTIGGGRVTADGEYTWGLAGRLTAKIRFTEVRLRSVLANVGGAGAFGRGRITGRIDLGGDSVRSANDITGTLTATLSGTSVQEVPILRVVTPYLSPTGLVSPFQSGEARARLANGVVRLERLELASETAKLHAEGTISLAGRLDLGVVAQTGQIGFDSRTLRLLGLRIPAFGPLPLTLIRDASEFLSNRTVRVSVTGTTKSPSVQVNAAALLTDQAIRFLLTKYTPFTPAEIPARP